MRAAALALMAGLCLIAAAGRPALAAEDPTVLAVINGEAARQAGGVEATPVVAVAGDTELQQLELQHQKMLARARIAEAEFALTDLRLQATMYRHHQFWTDAAAVMVYLLTGFGMVCAAAQFQLVARLRGTPLSPPRDPNQPPKPADPIQPQSPEPSAGMVKLPGGYEVSSPFLGVIILMISLGFFYLYLTVVYPITATSSAPITVG